MAFDVVEELEKLVDTLAADSIAYALVWRAGRRCSRLAARYDGHRPAGVGPPHQQVWEKRIEVPRRYSTLSIVSREGLATMKRFAGRPQDLADIARLEGNDDEET